MGTCRDRLWRTTQRAAGENKTRQENETPAIPAHAQGHAAIPQESPPALLTVPGGSQGIRHHQAGTLPCWHMLKESRAAAGNHCESTQGLRYLSGKGEGRCECKEAQAPRRGVPRTSCGTGTSVRL